MLWNLDGNSPSAQCRELPLGASTGEGVHCRGAGGAISAEGEWDAPLRSGGDREIGGVEGARVKDNPRADDRHYPE
jgi:hypothetical protein